jgi:hypothetical protein
MSFGPLLIQAGIAGLKSQWSRYLEPPGAETELYRGRLDEELGAAQAEPLTALGIGFVAMLDHAVERSARSIQS